MNKVIAWLWLALIGGGTIIVLVAGLGWQPIVGLAGLSLVMVAFFYSIAWAVDTVMR